MALSYAVIVNIRSRIRNCLETIGVIYVAGHPLLNGRCMYKTPRVYPPPK